MFMQFIAFQESDAYNLGKAFGYLVSSVICVVVVVVMPLIWFARSRKQRPRVGMFQIYKNGQQCGPYTVEQIRAYLSSGEFEMGDLAWYQNAWVPLSSIPTIMGR
jgi:hypothetical protein